MRLPQSVQEIADVIGNEQALFLVGQIPRCIVRDKRYPNAKRGRPMMHVPTKARMTRDHRLVHILGWVDAMKMVEVFGGEILQPANCEGIYQDFRRRSIIRMHAEGMDPQAIAELFDMTKTWVKTILRNSPQEEIHGANDNTLTRVTTHSSGQAANLSETA